MLNLPGINDAQYYNDGAVSTESLNQADAQMRNLLRVGGQLFDMAINAVQINEAVATGRVNLASVEGLYGNILDENGRVARISMEGVSDMASDAWEALKNWIKEIIRKVEDFFLKYSFFLKKTKQRLKDLRSQVRTKLSGGKNAKMTVDASGDSIREKWDDEHILNPSAFIDIFNRRAFGITVTEEQIKAIHGNSAQDTRARRERARTRALNQYRNNIGTLTSRADARLGIMGGVDRSELNLKLDEHVDEELEKLLDEDSNDTSVAMPIMRLISPGDPVTNITHTCDAYYKIADMIIKAKEQAVKDYDRIYKTVSKIKAGLNNQALRSIRQQLHQSLLALFKISSAFRKSASKLIKFVMSVMTYNNDHD